MENLLVNLGTKCPNQLSDQVGIFVPDKETLRGQSRWDRPLSYRSMPLQEPEWSAVALRVDEFRGRFLRRMPLQSRGPA